MSYYCPVCNGMQRLAAACPECGQPAADCGRFGDLLGPYAPYRPIEEMNRIAGDPTDWESDAHRCAHAACCSYCGTSFRLYVDEWNGYSG